ncbi:testis-specific serine/threonine-protein kinase 1-like [Cephus cinctus]|uniref:Testis-specific serine/threonine-protein kinase 1-like n=1 Tax=Cephus cinctus TaxID=211228 RepID=A0AAJ7RHP9_CEPCN|nr:testis-specific serine/threonine-protein kinase 1-like [Cephus cinctus]XP_024941124.1 testis-specific serine/threonine-protein kinase 1-like [Cephus cinctus]
MSQADLNQTASEEAILQARGYKLIKKLGEGSYAKVYLAEYRPENDPERNNSLACKVVDTVKAPKDFVRKFLPRELDILVKLNHPHVVHVHSIFQRRTKYFIFMRFAENGDLLDFILKNGAVAESQARVWLRQLSLGLQYLHEMEIAHRDMKCENVLLTSNYNVKLADFGFARYVVDARGKKVLSDTYCGSLSYAAPEILKGSPYNPKIADIWSLGVILYIILNKAMPFDDTNIKRLYEQQTNKRWKFRGKVTDILSEQAKKLVINLLEPDTGKRWRMDQVIHSEWIAMDPRLMILTPAEQTALNAAIEERKKNEEKLTKAMKSGKIDDKKKMGTDNGEDKNRVGEEVTIIKDAVKPAGSTIIGTGNYFRNLGASA